MLTLYNPLSVMTPWKSWVDEMWKDTEPYAKWPRFEVLEEDARLVMTAEIPGMKPEEVSVTVDGNALVVEAKHEESGEGYRKVGSFRRRFQLPTAVNGEAITAEMADGLLAIFLPKIEAFTTREIPIARAPATIAEKVPVEGAEGEAA